MTDPYRTPAERLADAVREVVEPQPETITAGRLSDSTPNEVRLWDSLVIAYVSSSNSTSSDGGPKWADKILAARRERFGRR